MTTKTPIQQYSIVFLILLTFAGCNLSTKQSNEKQYIDPRITDTISKAVLKSDISTKAADSSLNNQQFEDSIIDTILKLPEIKERAAHIEAQTKGTRSLKIWVDTKPNLPTQLYYWIKVGEDNGTNVVTHFNFHVYPDSMKIMYYDTQSGREMSVREWRAMKKDKRGNW